jgi:CDP-diacylglycerol--glycerol-3-phosphate 3-phosphatidyltransferase
MNLSNKITLSRIAIMPIFMISLEMHSILWNFVALLCFGYATYSDWLDGALARKYNWVTDFGKFMDPLADKIFISAAFISFVSIKDLNIPAWMVTIILSREFIITGLRTIAVSKNVVLPAQTSGKFKTVFQLIAIGVTIVVLLIKDFERQGIFTLPVDLNIVLFNLPLIFMWLVVILTVFSGVSYIYSNRTLITEIN